MHLSRPSFAKILVPIALMLVMIVPAAHATAITLDWSKVNVNWSSPNYGVITQNFDIDASNPGDDVTVTMRLGGTSNYDGKPSVVSSPIGSALNVQIGTSGPTAQVLISFDFHYSGGVKGVQIATNGVDVNADGEQEQLRNLYGSLGGKGLAPGSFTLPSSSSGLQLFTANGYPGVQGLARSSGTNTNASALMGQNVDLVGFAFGVSPNTPFNVSSINNFYLGNVTYTANTLSQAIVTSPLPGPAPVGGAGDVANPEPATLATLGSGLIGLGLLAHRRRKRS